MIRGEAAFRAALALKAEGFVPDVILAHPGWGESLFLKQVWPDTKLIIYCEFYYAAAGTDVGFDPEFPPSHEGEACRIQMKNVNGKEDTAFTVQYDLSSPMKFDLTYTGEDGQQHRTYVVHRSSIGSIERTMAFLIEKYAGEFPLWLSPVQARVLPVSDAQSAYAKEVVATLVAAGVRAEADTTNESLGKKIRTAKTEKIPYLLVVGDKEVGEKSVSVESRTEKIGAMEATALVALLKEQISAHA